MEIEHLLKWIWLDSRSFCWLLSFVCVEGDVDPHEIAKSTQDLRIRKGDVIRSPKDSCQWPKLIIVSER